MTTSRETRSETGENLELQLQFRENVLLDQTSHQAVHPFEIQCVPAVSDRATYDTRSMDHSVKKMRLHPKKRNRSFGSEDIGGATEDTTDRFGGKASGDVSSDTANVEELLPSRLAANDGTRSLALRRGSRSRSRRSLRRRPRESPEQDVSDTAALSRAAAEDEDEVDFSASKLEPDSTEDWETAEGLNSIRSCATTMQRKRQMRRQLLEKIAREQETKFSCQKLVIEANKWWKRQCELLANVFQNLQFWNKSFKTIEGTFGPCVMSYFVFVRLLLFMDIFIMLLILSTVIIPQVFIYSFDFMSENCQNVSWMSDMYVQEACNMSSLYRDHIRTIRRNASASQAVLSLFLGTGWMEDSVLFLGFYSSAVSSVKGYDMALAYLLTTGFYLAVILIFMVIYTGHGLKEHMLRFGDQSTRAFDRVFCGWDFSLSNAASAQAKHKSVFMEFQRIFMILRKREEKKIPSLANRCCLVARRLFGHFVVVALLFGAGATIAATVIIGTPNLQALSYVKDRDFLYLVVSFLPSLVVTVLNALLPIFFRSIAPLEKYSDETQLRVTLIRTVFLRLASIFVLVATFLVQFKGCSKSSCVLPSNSSLVTYCWETYLGQQLYRLVLLDFFTVLVVLVFYEFPMSFLSKRFPRCCCRQSEFDVPQNVIDITYTQALCWIGAFFCPLIPAITILKLLIFFLVKKNTLVGNYKPKPSSASGTTYFFMIILMIAFVLCAAAVAYAIGRLPPSKSCGPFRVHSHEKVYMFGTLTAAIRSLPPVPQKFFFVIGSWIFYLALIILISLVITWRCMKLDAHQELVAFLKDRIKAEHADKEFLLHRVKTMGAAR